MRETIKNKDDIKGKDLGKIGERLAARHLRKRGYRIIERSYRSSVGEIDIISKKGDYLVFVEVKTRRGDKFGKPFESVSKKKQAKIVKIAESYYSNVKHTDLTCRFDVISIEAKDDNYFIDHIENAFQ